MQSPFYLVQVGLRRFSGQILPKAAPNSNIGQILPGRHFPGGKSFLAGNAVTERLQKIIQ